MQKPGLAAIWLLSRVETDAASDLPCLPQLKSMMLLDTSNQPCSTSADCLGTLPLRISTPGYLTAQSKTWSKRKDLNGSKS